MNPKSSMFGLALASSTLSQLLEAGASWVPPAPSFRPLPAQGAPSQWTPEMRKLVATESERLKVSRPDLNAKGRKKVARQLALSVERWVETGSFERSK